MGEAAAEMQIRCFILDTLGSAIVRARACISVSPIAYEYAISANDVKELYLAWCNKSPFVTKRVGTKTLTTTFVSVLDSIHAEVGVSRKDDRTKGYIFSGKAIEKVKKLTRENASLSLPDATSITSLDTLTTFLDDAAQAGPAANDLALFLLSKATEVVKRKAADARIAAFDIEAFQASDLAFTRDDHFTDKSLHKKLERWTMCLQGPRSRVPVLREVLEVGTLFGQEVATLKIELAGEEVVVLECMPFRIVSHCDAWMAMVVAKKKEIDAVIEEWRAEKARKEQEEREQKQKADGANLMPSTHRCTG